MTDLDELMQLASAETISDELLAAYFDGNTTTEENALIESSASEEDLKDIFELVADSQSFEENLHLYDSDYDFWGLGNSPALASTTDDNWLHIPSPEYINWFSLKNNHDVFLKKDYSNVSHTPEQDEFDYEEHEEHFEEDDFEEFIEDENINF